MEQALPKEPNHTRCQLPCSTARVQLPLRGLSLYRKGRMRAEDVLPVRRHTAWERGEERLRLRTQCHPHVREGHFGRIRRPRLQEGGKDADPSVHRKEGAGRDEGRSPGPVPVGLAQHIERRLVEAAQTAGPDGFRGRRAGGSGRGSRGSRGAGPARWRPYRANERNVAVGEACSCALRAARLATTTTTTHANSHGAASLERAVPATPTPTTAPTSAATGCTTSTCIGRRAAARRRRSGRAEQLDRPKVVVGCLQERSGELRYRQQHGPQPQQAVERHDDPNGEVCVATSRVLVSEDVTSNGPDAAVAATWRTPTTTTMPSMPPPITTSSASASATRMRSSSVATAPRPADGLAAVGRLEGRWSEAAGVGATARRACPAGWCGPCARGCGGGGGASAATRACDRWAAPAPCRCRCRCRRGACDGSSSSSPTSSVR